MTTIVFRKHGCAVSIAFPGRDATEEDLDAFNADHTHGPSFARGWRADEGHEPRLSGPSPRERAALGFVTAWDAGGNV